MEALQTQVGGDHYQKYAIQPAEFIARNRIEWVPGNIIKYVCRFRDKNGKDDLLKAQHYLAILIEAEYPPEPLTLPQMVSQILKSENGTSNLESVPIDPETQEKVRKILHDRGFKGY